MDPYITNDVLQPTELIGRIVCLPLIIRSDKLQINYIIYLSVVR